MNTLKTANVIGATLVNKTSGTQDLLFTGKSKIPENWNPAFLIEYITNLHHKPAKENAVIIYDLSQKVLYQQCGKYPEISKLATRIYFFFNDFLSQMKTEDEILFPEIKRLSKIKKIQPTDKRFNCSEVKNIITKLQTAHLHALEGLRQIRRVTKGYTLLSGAPVSFINLYERLKKFENDLAEHVYLENNILYPKTLALTEILSNGDKYKSA